MIFSKIESKFCEQRNKAMIQYGSNTWCFDDYISLKNYFFKSLTNSGIYAGCCVAFLISKSHISFLLAATLRLFDATILMLDAKMSDYELEENMIAYKPEFLISDEERIISIDGCEKTNSIVQADLTLHLYHYKCMGKWDNIAANSKLRGSFVFFTSGSTKLPKAVLRTQANIDEDATNNIESFNISSEDKVLCAASFTHAYGFGSGSIPYLSAGATVKFINPASTYSILRRELTLNSYTVFVGLPVHYLMLAENHDEPLNLRSAIISGNVISNSLVDLVREKLGIYLNNMYGMTELGCVAVLRGNVNEKSKYSVGLPLSNVYLKMGESIQQDNNGRSLYKVLVKSKSLSPGYYDYDACSFSSIELSDGWFDTNDLGYIDEGNLYITCRNDDMINCSGKKINPLEIENVVMQYPGIKEVAVVGIKDSKQGEIPVAYLASNNVIDKQALVRFCHEKLAIYKVPRAIIQIEQLPRTRTGKLLRNKLKRDVSV